MSVNVFNDGWSPERKIKNGSTHIEFIAGCSVLQTTQNTWAKILGPTITSDLKWNSHIQRVTAKAKSVLGRLRRNLTLCRGGLPALCATVGIIPGG